LLGRTEPEFGGSAWAHVCHGHLGGRPPRPDLDAERRLAALLAAAVAAGLLSAAHDLSDGGLAVALAESCLRGGTGCTVPLPGDRTSADRTAWRPCSARGTRAPIPSRKTSVSRPGTCCTRWPRAIRAVSLRYGSRRWPPCSASPARCTPGARRRTWSRPTR